MNLISKNLRLPSLIAGWLLYSNSSFCDVFRVNGVEQSTAGGGISVETDPIYTNGILNYYTKAESDIQYVNEGQTNAITTVMITNDAVTSAKILDGEIVNADINANAAIAATKIANTALVQITTFSGDATGTYNNIQIAAGAVGASELADGATLSEIADDDGAGSGLDADLLDGRDVSTFATNLIFYDEGGDDFGEYPSAYGVDELASVAHGALCVASGSAATVSGGYNNQARSGRATIGGGQGNAINYAADYSTIGGGSANSIVTGDYVVVAGGSGNATKNDYVTISGGRDNNVGSIDGIEYGGDNSYSVVGGGYYNHIGAGAAYTFIGGGQFHIIQDNSDYSAILGGYDNTISGVGNALYSTIAGGSLNTIDSGDYAFIAGGSANQANADYAFAAGRNANASHQGSFVWGDGTTNSTISSTSNQVVFRAQNGLLINATNFASGVAIMSGGNIAPSISNAYSLGTDSLRWSTVYVASVVNHASPLLFINSGGTPTAILGTDGALWTAGSLTGTNVVASLQIVNNTITDTDISNSANINPNKITNTSLVQNTIFNGDIGGNYNTMAIQNNAITNTDIGPNANIDPSKINGRAVVANALPNYNDGAPAPMNTPFTNSGTWRIIEGTYAMNGGGAATAELSFYFGSSSATTVYHNSRHTDPNLDRRPFRVDLPPNWVGLWTNLSTGAATSSLENVRWRNL